MSKLGSIAVNCIIGLVIAFGLYLFWKGARNVQRAIASVSWPKAKGVVTGSELAERTNRDAKTGASSVMYSTTTSVRYQVNGQDYSTTLIRFGQTFGSGDASEAALEHLRYPVGAEVNVSYHPHDPSIAAVKPGLHADAFWLPGAGLAFLLPAIMCIIGMSSVNRALAGGGDSTFAIIAGLFAAIFCAGGTLMLTSGLLRMWHGNASQTWPTTTGEVVFTKLSISEAARKSRDESPDDVKTYSPQFVYQYEVEGVKHYNNIRRFGRVAAQGESWAREVARRYPIGSKVSVSYFPADPDVATLETGNDQEALYLPGAGLAALLFGVAVFVFIVPSLAKFP